MNLSSWIIWLSLTSGAAFACKSCDIPFPRPEASKPAYTLTVLDHDTDRGREVHLEQQTLNRRERKHGKASCPIPLTDEKEACVGSCDCVQTRGFMKLEDGKDHFYLTIKCATVEQTAGCGHENCHCNYQSVALRLPPNHDASYTHYKDGEKRTEYASKGRR